MALGLVARSAVAISDQLNSIVRVLKGTDPDNVYVRLPTAGSFEVRHSVTNAPVLRVTDSGLAAAIDGALITDGTVSSAEIASNTIVDADISPTAAMQVTKLAHVGANSVLRSNGTQNVGGPVVTNDMVANTINADRLLDASITSSKLGTGITAPAAALLATVGPLGAPQAKATFTSISGAYKSLELRISGQSTAAVIAEAVRLQANSITSAGYYNQLLQAGGVAASAAEAIAAISADIGSVPGASTTPVQPSWTGSITAWLPGYTRTTGYRSVHAIGYSGWTTASGGQSITIRGTNMTGVAGAITSLDVFPLTGSWATGSIISLYGYT